MHTSLCPALTEVVCSKVDKVFVAETRFGLKHLKEIHHGCLKYCLLKSIHHHVVLWTTLWVSGPGPDICKYILWFILLYLGTRWMGVKCFIGL